MKSADELTAKLERAEEAKKAHAIAWLALDRLRTRQRNLGGIWALILFVGLLIAGTYASSGAIYGALVGMGAAGTACWFNSREKQFETRLETLWWQGREAESQCAAIRSELALRSELAEQ